MTLQTSGPISLANIQTEFGGSNPISLSEYYGRAAGIPGSGAISIGAFYGKSSVTPPVVSLTPDVVDAFANTNGGTQTINSNVAVGISGGVAPFTTTVTKLSGGLISASVISTTLVRITSSAAANATRVGTFRVTVTDSIGQTGFKDIAATHEYANNA